MRVGSVCEIKLYDLDVSFTDIDAVEGLIPFHSDNGEDLTNVDDDGMRIWWGRIGQTLTASIEDNEVALVL